VSEGWVVVAVVDGDTVKVRRAGSELTVRLIGLDTPETVDPARPVECFGPEASAFARARLAGRTVTLELDPSQGRRDVYGRTLAYVWLDPPSGERRLFNWVVVRQGFAVEYTYDRSYRWRRAFIRAENKAAAAGLGLWSPSGCGGPG
jgi:micrococcal nuclease